MATLKHLRELMLLSQSELAHLVGVSLQTIYEWEHARARPSPVNRRKLVEVLKITPAELLQTLEETAEEGKKEGNKERPAA